jgi:DNA replication protein DnaC
MEARVLKLQEMAKNRKFSHEEYESLRKNSLKREEEKRREEHIDSLIKKIPLRFRKKTFYDFSIKNTEQNQMKLLTERFVETFNERVRQGSNLIFVGKPGTGKTLLSLIIYQELARNGFSVQYESSTEFLKKLIEIKFKSQSLFHNEMVHLQRIQLLIIDEVTESINKDGMFSSMEKQLFFHLINERYENQLCTLVISNRNKSDLINRLGLPVVDRLLENGVLCAFSWESYRQ